MRRRISLLLLLSIVLAGGAVQDAHADYVTLGLRVTGVGASVSTVPTGTLNSCRGARCFYVFPRGTSLTLTATPTAPGSSFAKWLGACQNQASVCRIVLDANKNVTARFSPVLLYADQQAGHGNVFPSPVGQSCGYRCWSYPYGSQVALSAQATDGDRFSGWNGACSGVSSDSCVLDLFENVQAAPNFECVSDVCSLSQPLERSVFATVTVRGGGYVLVNNKRCDGVCRYEFRRGLMLVFRAYPQSRFAGWGGWCRGRSPCQFSAFRNAFQALPRVTATFR